MIAANAERAQCAPVLPSVWLTAAEAGAYLRVQTRTVLAWARQGKVKAYALSGTARHCWRFRVEDLDAVMMGSPVVLSHEGRIQ